MIKKRAGGGNDTTNNLRVILVKIKVKIDLISIVVFLLSCTSPRLSFINSPVHTLSNSKPTLYITPHLHVPLLDIFQVNRDSSLMWLGNQTRTMIFCNICSFFIFANVRLIIWFLKLRFHECCQSCFYIFKL